MRLEKLLLLLLLGLSWLPLIQWRVSLVKEQRLYGMEQNQEQPRLTWKALWDGKFQEEFDRWFSGKLGFRSYLIRSENELNFALFRDVSSRSPSKIILGKENYLFERGYVRSYLNPDYLPDTELERKVANLARLQKELGKRNIGFLLLISPSKANLYPEFLPDLYQRASKTSSSDYQVFVASLRDAGVPFLDGRAMLAQQKQQGMPVFAKGGTHWSYISACFVAAKIVEQIEQQTGLNLYNIDCSQSYTTEVPRFFDKDLAQLMNIWSTHKLYQRLPYPKHASLITGGEVRPEVVFVGSSFMWPVLYYIDKRKIFKRRDFLYYFQTRYSGDKKRPIDPAKINWERDIFSRQAVIIEINESVLGETGFGFVEAALRALRTPG